VGQREILEAHHPQVKASPKTARRRVLTGDDELSKNRASG